MGESREKGEMGWGAEKKAGRELLAPLYSETQRMGAASGRGRPGDRRKGDVWRDMLVRCDGTGGPFVEAPAMPAGGCVAAVPSQMGPLRRVMPEMPLPECVCGS